MEPLIFLIPIPRLAEGEFKWGGAVSPTLTCSTEIYVYEVIYDSSNEGKESR